MKLMRRISHRLDSMKKLELCPSILNLNVERYSFSFFLNDILSGVKIFLLLFPIAFSLSFFCGASPLHGIVSCAIASFCSVVFGGSRYQISSIAFPLCVVTFEILVKYQYKGLFFTAIFVSIILIFFGILRFSSVLKHLSTSYVSALSVCVAFSVIVNQLQNIFGINTFQSSQSFFENLDTLFENMNMVSLEGSLTALGFIAPLILIRFKIKSYFSFFIYFCLGSLVVIAQKMGFLSFLPPIKTVGSELINAQVFENITTISRSVPSQTFLLNIMNYAFAISVIIAAEACLCTNIAASITGNRKLQANAELISSGVMNFLSVACGGLFVSPDTNLTLKNISYKAKTVLGLVFIGAISFVFLHYAGILINYIPVSCISTILIVFALSIILNKNPLQYLNYKNYESYIFIATMFSMLYFGFVPAVIIGFTTANVFFSKRMIKIKDATVHTTKNHDAGAIDFMLKKNGFTKSPGLPQNIMDRIEVIQISNILFLNVAKVVEESLRARGAFPSVLIIYFKNVPFLDGDAINSLKYIVSKAKDSDCMVIVSGTNGMLLEILKQKAQEENLGQAFGYIVPNFNEAVKKTIERLK